MESLPCHIVPKPGCPRWEMKGPRWTRVGEEEGRVAMAWGVGDTPEKLIKITNHDLLGEILKTFKN